MHAYSGKVVITILKQRHPPFEKRRGADGGEPGGWARQNSLYHDCLHFAIECNSQRVKQAVSLSLAGRIISQREGNTDRT